MLRENKSKVSITTFMQTIIFSSNWIFYILILVTFRKNVNYEIINHQGQSNGNSYNIGELQREIIITNLVHSR